VLFSSEVTSGRAMHWAVSVDRSCTIHVIHSAETLRKSRFLSVSTQLSTKPAYDAELQPKRFHRTPRTANRIIKVYIIEVDLMRQEQAHIRSAHLNIDEYEGELVH
jgi:hypothetical protein